MNNNSHQRLMLLPSSCEAPCNNISSRDGQAAIVLPEDEQHGDVRLLRLRTPPAALMDDDHDNFEELIQHQTTTTTRLPADSSEQHQRGHSANSNSHRALWLEQLFCQLDGAEQWQDPVEKRPFGPNSPSWRTAARVALVRTELSRKVVNGNGQGISGAKRIMSQLLGEHCMPHEATIRRRNDGFRSVAVALSLHLGRLVTPRRAAACFQRSRNQGYDLTVYGESLLYRHGKSWPPAPEGTTALLITTPSAPADNAATGNATIAAERSPTSISPSESALRVGRPAAAVALSRDHTQHASLCCGHHQSLILPESKAPEQHASRPSSLRLVTAPIITDAEITDDHQDRSRRRASPLLIDVDIIDNHEQEGFGDSQSTYSASEGHDEETPTAHPPTNMKTEVPAAAAAAAVTTTCYKRGKAGDSKARRALPTVVIDDCSNVVCRQQVVLVSPYGCSLPCPSPSNKRRRAMTTMNVVNGTCSASSSAAPTRPPAKLPAATMTSLPLLSPQCWDKVK